MMGHKAWVSAADLTEAPDPACLVVPSKQVISAMKELGEKGVKNSIIVTVGFCETGDEGQANQDQLNHISRQYGSRFSGFKRL